MNNSLPAEFAGYVGKGVGKEGEIQDVFWQQLFYQAALGVAQVVMERFRRHGLVPRLPLGEADEGGRPDSLEDVVGVRVQPLVGADEVVPDGAGLAQVVDGHPVLVHPLRLLVQQVPEKLGEGHVVARRVPPVLPVPPDDLHPVLLLVLLDLPKFIPVGRQQPLHGVAHEDELVVVLQAVADLVRLHVAQEHQVALVVHLQLDVDALQRPVQHLQDALPVGAGHLGHVAVQEAVLVADQEVPEDRPALTGRQLPDAAGHGPLPADGADGAVADVPQHLALQLAAGLLLLLAAGAADADASPGELPRRRVQRRRLHLGQDTLLDHEEQPAGGQDHAEHQHGGQQHGAAAAADHPRPGPAAARGGRPPHLPGEGGTGEHGLGGESGRRRRRLSRRAACRGRRGDGGEGGRLARLPAARSRRGGGRQ